MKSLPLGGGLRSSTLPLGGAGMELESEQWSHGLSLYYNCWLQEIKLCLKDSPHPTPLNILKKKVKAVYVSELCCSSFRQVSLL